jgi:hypothetical protein
MPIYVEHIDDIICNRKKENENDYWLHPFCILVVGRNLNNYSINTQSNFPIQLRHTVLFTDT